MIAEHRFHRGLRANTQAQASDVKRMSAQTTPTVTSKAVTVDNRNYTAYDERPLACLLRNPSREDDEWTLASLARRSGVIAHRRLARRNGYFGITHRRGIRAVHAG